jgi:dimethylhistidine N-methyltransferase
MENNGEFKNDVIKGLTSNPKRLSSKYFYDDEGSRIFQEIMEMPEYYLTDAEFDILRNKASEITDLLEFEDEFSVIELGAGNGKKTFELLEHMVKQGLKVHYRPVDISTKAINLLEADLSDRLPNLLVESLVGDYFHVLENLPDRTKPALFLFLGSNIGNYEHNEAVSLLKKFANFLQPGDKMMVGFDIIKNPRVILTAYDDPAGITKRFNLNLLSRINKELGTDFEIEKFDFFPYYNPNNGELRSCIVSLEDQIVKSSQLKTAFHFAASELIHTELSKKYSLEEISSLAYQSGYVFIKNFCDDENLFADSLWMKA